MYQILDLATDDKKTCYAGEWWFQQEGKLNKNLTTLGRK
jgi:hypothetical protein